MNPLKNGGVNFPSEIICYCGETAEYHHTTDGRRRDGKITIWYKCPNDHRCSLDVVYKSSIKPIENRKQKEKKKYEMPQE